MKAWDKNILGLSCDSQGPLNQKQQTKMKKMKGSKP